MRYARFNEFSRRRRHRAGEAMILPEEGTLLQFFGGGDPVFAGGFGKNER
jgi:hypothetical protein